MATLEILLKDKDMEIKKFEIKMQEKEKEISEMAENLVDLEEKIKNRNKWYKLKGKEDLSEPRDNNASQDIEIRNRFQIFADSDDNEMVTSYQKRKEVEVQDSATDKKRGCSGNILMIGGSNVWNLGRALEYQNARFVTKSYKGAKIEDITRKIEEMNRSDSKKSQVVIMTGGNDMEKDGTEVIVSKFKELIAAADERFHTTMVIGLLPRNDLGGWYYESKRLAINLQLEKMCQTKGIKFIACNFYAERNEFLCRDGLHLNNLGADRVGRFIYKNLNLY